MRIPLKKFQNVLLLKDTIKTEKVFIMMRYFLAAMLMVLCAVAGAESKVKYVFLLIGDGFGPNQRIVAEAALGGKLVMNTLPTGNLLTGTDTFDGKTTDSAASGTAISIGQKTHTYAIGVDRNDNPVEGLAAELKRVRGMSVGIISSCGVTDGTAAAQFAHRAKRYDYHQIADQMVKSDFDLFGGFGIFESPDIDNREKLEAEYRRKLRENGWIVLEDPADYPSLQAGKRTFVPCPPYIEWRKDKPGFFGRMFEEKHLTLADYLNGAAKAFESNPNGFYIMLECGRIDHAGHNNDAGMTVREVRAFDEAVAAALDFAKKHPEETIVVVTADHETGGLVIKDMDKLKANAPLLWKQTESLETAAKRIQPLLDWKDEALIKVRSIVVPRITEVIGIEFTEAEIKELEQMAAKKTSAFRLLKRAAAMRDARLGICYTSGGHTNAKVLTGAAGAGHELFKSRPLENSSLRGIISQIMGLR